MASNAGARPLQRLVPEGSSASGSVWNPTHLSQKPLVILAFRNVRRQRPLKEWPARFLTTSNLSHVLPSEFGIYWLATATASGSLSRKRAPPTPGPWSTVKFFL